MEFIKNNKKEIQNLFFIFIITRLCYIVYQLMTTFLFGNNFLDVFTFMDGENYLHIAKFGYDEPKFYAFFPLIPFLIKIISLYGLIILNNIIAFISSILLYKTFNKNAAILFLLSPIQIFCYIPYTESIFIFLTILCFYLFKEKKYLLLGISLGLSVCCRNIGSMMFFSIFIGFVYDIYKKQRTIKDLFISYIPATLISLIYPIYLQIICGKWNIFITTQFDYWDAKNSNLFKTIYYDCLNFIHQDLYGKYLIILTYVVLSFCIISLIKYKKMDVSIFLYFIFSLLIITSNCKNLYLEHNIIPSNSYFRYFLGCFSLYIGLSFYKNQKLIRNVFIFLHILIGINFFVNGWPF